MTEEFQKGSFTPRTHQMISVQTTPEFLKSQQSSVEAVVASQCLMISALVPRSSGPGPTVPGVKMGTGELLGKPNKLRGSDLRWTIIPSRGSRNTPSRFMLQKQGYTPAAMSQSAPKLHIHLTFWVCVC